MVRNKNNKARKKLAILFLLAFALLLLGAVCAEASAWSKSKDTIKNTWTKAKKFVKSGQFWVNALIAFAALFIISAIVTEKQGLFKDTSSKVILYILIAVITIAIAANIVDMAGNPIYVWKKASVQDATKFLLGSSETPTMKSCDGAGAYEKKGSVSALAPRCRQGILRINNEKGLPSFLVATILIFIFLTAKKKYLGFEGSSTAAKYVPFLLAILLGALITNEGTTKSTVLMIGGWVFFFILADLMSKAMNQDKKDDDKDKSKGLAYGLSFAIVQSVANILGTSLVGDWWFFYPKEDVTMGRILVYFFIGIVIGFLWDTATKGQGVLKKYFDRLGRKQQEEVDELLDNGRWGKALIRGLPLVGHLFRKKDSDEAISTEENLERRLERLSTRRLDAMERGDYEEAERIGRGIYEIQNGPMQQMMYDPRYTGIPPINRRNNDSSSTNTTTEENSDSENSDGGAT